MFQLVQIDHVAQLHNARLLRKCPRPIGEDTHLERPGERAARNEVAGDGLGLKFLTNPAGYLERTFRSDKQQVRRGSRQNGVQ